MKLYQHIIVISALILLIILFYKDGYGAVPFLLAAVYLSSVFIKEIWQSKKDS